MYCTNSFKIHFDEANVVDYLTVSSFIVNQAMNLTRRIDDFITDPVIERSQ